jgi:hypothetical protein
MTMGTSNDALATIAGLKQRIEWLEESIGRLLVPPPFCQTPKPLSNLVFFTQIEKEQNAAATKLPARDNCCVTFTDASPDLERAITNGQGSNCCVQFRSSKSNAQREQMKIRRVVAFTLLVVPMLLFLGAILTSSFTKEKPSLIMEGESTSLKLD